MSGLVKLKLRPLLGMTVAIRDTAPQALLLAPIARGLPGKSTFELAVEDGYEGTLEQWLAEQGGGSWDNLQGKPDEFPPEAHQHEIADVNGLQAALDAAGGGGVTPAGTADGQVQLRGSNGAALAAFASFKYDQATNTLNVGSASTFASVIGFPTGNGNAAKMEVDTLGWEPAMSWSIGGGNGVRSLGLRAYGNKAHLTMNAAGGIGWTGQAQVTSGLADTELQREAAGVVAITDGDQSSPSYRDLKLRNLTVAGLLHFGPCTNATEPSFINGAAFFNTDLDKLRIGGAAGWETVTSA